MKKRIIKIIDSKTALRIFSKRKEIYINKKMIEYVNKIISEVKKKGDFALIKFMKKIENFLEVKFLTLRAEVEFFQIFLLKEGIELLA